MKIATLIFFLVPLIEMVILIEVGGVIGALPAGVIGVRIGRRNTMLLGFATLALCLVALDRVSTVEQAVPWLALASASWT